MTGRVGPVSGLYSKHDEGAPDPSQSGTGDTPNPAASGICPFHLNHRQSVTQISTLAFAHKPSCPVPEHAISLQKPAFFAKTHFANLH